MRHPMQHFGNRKSLRKIFFDQFTLRSHHAIDLRVFADIILDGHNVLGDVAWELYSNN
jgi:hypothetical protein